MIINVQTQANNGNLILYILDSKENELLKLRNSNNGSCMLVPGKTYRLEWHVWSANAAEYGIIATIAPENVGFPPFQWISPQASYSGPHQDMGGFYFTV